MKSPLSSCSIVVTLLAVCRFSDAFDWENHPNGQLVKSEVIFSLPRNVVFGTINGGGDVDTTQQYMWAARIRSYKLLYVLAKYCEYTFWLNSPSYIRSTISRPTEKVIDFMKRHKTDISDLEKLLKDTVSNPNYARAGKDLTVELLWTFQDRIYQLLFNDVKIFNIIVLGVSPDEQFDGRLAEAIKAWTFFDNLADDEESKKYIPANFEQNCMFPTQYFYNKIYGEHKKPKKKEAEQGNGKKETEEDKKETEEDKEITECSVM